MTAMWEPQREKELRQLEEDKKFWRNMREMQRRECQAKLDSGVDCKYCTLHNTTKCLQPDKATNYPFFRY